MARVTWSQCAGRDCLRIAGVDAELDVVVHPRLPEHGNPGQVAGSRGESAATMTMARRGEVYERGFTKLNRFTPAQSRRLVEPAQHGRLPHADDAAGDGARKRH